MAAKRRPPPPGYGEAGKRAIHSGPSVVYATDFSVNGREKAPKAQRSQPQPKGRWTRQVGRQKGKGTFGRGIRLQTLFPIPCRSFLCPMNFSGQASDCKSCWEWVILMDCTAAPNAFRVAPFRGYSLGLACSLCYRLLSNGARPACYEDGRFVHARDVRGEPF